MHRTVSAVLDLEVTASATVALQVAVAPRPGLDIDEQFEAGAAQEVLRISGPLSGVQHVLRVEPGDYRIDYRATVAGQAEPYPEDLGSALTFCLPSRYCESDRLFGSAQDLFGGLSGMELLEAVRTWVNQRLDYVLDSSRVTDSAIDTFLARDGVCRDFAHLSIALLRAREIPARLVACYAPGLDPMDFHAVTEAWVEGQWHALDATGLAPRSTLLRICTGRDAVDTSFMTSFGGQVTLRSIAVSAVSEGDLPVDDHTGSVVLG